MIDYIFFATIVATALFVLTALIRFRLMRGARRDNLRYKLFAVRDDLIQLVARNELVESDLIFQEFYSMVNVSIKHIDTFTLSEIVKVSREHKNRLEQNEKFKKLMHELDRKSDEVKLVVGKFFGTMIEILVLKSILLRILLPPYVILSILSKSLRKLIISNHMPKGSLESYRAYEFYQDSRVRLGLASQ